jgi:alpha-tubulin suppressor-like RCC1 family protein
MRKHILKLASALMALAISLSFVACSGEDDKPAVDPIAVREVSLSQATMDLAVGGQGKDLTATVLPTDAANKSVTWSSSVSGFVNIVGTGATVMLNPAAEGTTTITVTTQDGNKTAECVVTVTDPNPAVHVTGVTLSQTTMALAPGATRGLTATIEPGGATNKNVTWSSDRESVATVAGDAGNALAATVTAVAEGTAKITVTTADGNKTATCAVTVATGQVATATALAGGNYHSLGVKENGGLWAWGDNYYAQLGDGTQENRLTPVQAGGGASDWVSVAGYEHTVALKADGSLWTWGYNWYGQVGDGTRDNRATPYQMPGGDVWAAVTVGQHHTVAIKADGSLWAWGWNLYRQLGDGTQIDRYSPVRVGEDDDWVAVSAGYEHTMAIKKDGSLWAWGDGFWGQLGDGCSDDTSTPRPRPYCVDDGDDWAAVEAGSYHTLAIKKDGSLWSWGYNSHGMLGLGDYMVERDTPQPVPGGGVWVSVSAGHRHTMAIKADGSLWACGGNYNGQLGDGSFDERHSFVPVGSATDWAAVAVGNNHTLAVRDNGDLWAWGSNYYGAVGDGSTDDRNLPVKIGEGYRVPAK